MNVTVRFQGIIADMLGRKTDHLELPDGATIGDLVATLTEEDETAQSVLKQTRAFIDGRQADCTAALANGVEVIFMRPIAGGAGEGDGVMGWNEGSGSLGSLPPITPSPLLRRH